MLRIIPGPCIGGLGVRGFSEAQELWGTVRV